MKKVLSFLVVSLMAISFVLAAQGDGIQANLVIQNQGEESGLQAQAQVQSGNYVGADGEQMQVQTQAENRLMLNVGGVEAGTSMNMTREQIQNRTKLEVKLSNGMNTEVKIMPNTASETAIARLRMKACNETNNCSIELKDVGSEEQIRAAYEVKAKKEVKVLGLFRARMNVEAQVDAETGEVIRERKAWWAFIATE